MGWAPGKVEGETTRGCFGGEGGAGRAFVNENRVSTKVSNSFIASTKGIMPVVDMLHDLGRQPLKDIYRHDAIEVAGASRPTIIHPKSFTPYTVRFAEPTNGLTQA